MSTKKTIQGYTYIFGHYIELIDGQWIYPDTGEVHIPRQHSNRLCPKCKMPQLPNKCDPCLGMLPGVLNACCGHGLADNGGYIHFENGTVIRSNTLDVDNYPKIV